MTPDALETHLRPKFEFDGPYDHLVSLGLVIRTPSSRVAELVEDLESLPNVMVVYKRVTGSKRLWVVDQDPQETRP